MLKATHNGDQLEIRYSLKTAEGFQDVADTFQIEGPTLRLVKSKAHRTRRDGVRAGLAPSHAPAQTPSAK